MPSRGQILLLVGPKGSGKTTLGRILERRMGACFLEVEEIAQRVLASMGGHINEEYAQRALGSIVDAVESISDKHKLVVLESTGASEQTHAFIEALKAHHRVHLIRVHAREETCARRIKTRDNARQVEVPEDLIRTMHARSEALQLPWDLEIHNEAPLAEEEVVSAFQRLDLS